MSSGPLFSQTDLSLQVLMTTIAVSQTFSPLETHFPILQHRGVYSSGTSPPEEGEGGQNTVTHWKKRHGPRKSVIDVVAPLTSSFFGRVPLFLTQLLFQPLSQLLSLILSQLRFFFISSLLYVSSYESNMSYSFLFQAQLLFHPQPG